MQSHISHNVTPAQWAELPEGKVRIILDFQANLYTGLLALRKFFLGKNPAGVEELGVAATDGVRGLVEQVAAWALERDGDEFWVLADRLKVVSVETMNYSHEGAFGGDVLARHYTRNRLGRYRVTVSAPDVERMRQWFDLVRNGMAPGEAYVEPTLKPWALELAEMWLRRGHGGAQLKSHFPSLKKVKCTLMSPCEATWDGIWFTCGRDGHMMRCALVQALAPEIPGYVSGPVPARPVLVTRSRPKALKSLSEVSVTVAAAAPAEPGETRKSVVAVLRVEGPKEKKTSVPRQKVPVVTRKRKEQLDEEAVMKKICFAQLGAAAAAARVAAGGENCAARGQGSGEEEEKKTRVPTAVESPVYGTRVAGGPGWMTFRVGNAAGKVYGAFEPLQGATAEAAPALPCVPVANPEWVRCEEEFMQESLCAEKLDEGGLDRFLDVLMAEPMSDELPELAVTASGEVYGLQEL
jgi:hypothetical protein